VTTVHDHAPGDAEAKAEAALDRLVAADAVDEADDGTLTTTAAFEQVRRIYHDTYAHMDDEGVYDTVSDLFGLTREEAAEAIESDEVSVEELVAYLSARSYLEDRGEHPDPETLGVMARLLVEIGPGSPVPQGMTEIDDDSYEAFLAENPDAVVTVWKHHCDPCEAMKEEIDAVLAAVPEGVAVAGVDGEAVASFRADYDVTVAPSVLAFRGGELEGTLTGRQTPPAVAELFESVYDAEGG
jgi:thiol-disulfide isomerase/thioredoxin